MNLSRGLTTYRNLFMRQQLSSDRVTAQRSVLMRDAQMATQYLGQFQQALGGGEGSFPPAVVAVQVR